MSDWERNQLILKWIIYEHGRGKRIIVLTEYKRHVMFLAKALLKMKINAIPVIGDVHPRMRKRAYQHVAKGEAVLIATKLADEGLDIPSLDTLFLATSAKSLARVQQQIGRIMRSHPGKKEAIFYDFVDVNVKTFREQAKARIRFYRSMNYPLSKGS